MSVYGVVVVKHTPKGTTYRAGITTNGIDRQVIGPERTRPKEAIRDAERLERRLQEEAESDDE